MQITGSEQFSREPSVFSDDFRYTSIFSDDSLREAEFLNIRPHAFAQIRHRFIRAFDAADIKRIALLGRLSPSALSRSSAQRSTLSSRASSAPNASSRLLISKPCFLSGSHFSLSKPSEASAERTFSQLFRTSGSSQRRFSRCSAPRSMRSVLLLCPVRPLPHSYRI